MIEYKLIMRKCKCLFRINKHKIDKQPLPSDKRRKKVDENFVAWK